MNKILLLLLLHQDVGWSTIVKRPLEMTTMMMAIKFECYNTPLRTIDDHVNWQTNVGDGSIY